MTKHKPEGDYILTNGVGQVIERGSLADCGRAILTHDTRDYSIAPIEEEVEVGEDAAGEPIFETRQKIWRGIPEWQVSIKRGNNWPWQDGAYVLAPDEDAADEQACVEAAENCGEGFSLYKEADWHAMIAQMIADAAGDAEEIVELINSYSDDAEFIQSILSRPIEDYESAAKVARDARDRDPAVIEARRLAAERQKECDRWYAEFGREYHAARSGRPRTCPRPLWMRRFLALRPNAAVKRGDLGVPRWARVDIPAAEFSQSRAT